MGEMHHKPFPPDPPAKPRGPADIIIRNLCNEWRNSDLRADNPELRKRLNEAMEADKARIATLEADRAAATDLVARQAERIARLEREQDEARAKVTEYESIKDTPAEIQLNCGTSRGDRLSDVLRISKSIYAELRADRDHLDWLECFLVRKVDAYMRSQSHGGSELFFLVLNRDCELLEQRFEGDSIRAAIRAARKAGA